MELILKENELNQIAKGSVLFQKGERIQFIGMVVRGRIRITRGGIVRYAKNGEIIGLADVFASEYLGEYVAEEDTIFYAFPAFDSESLERFLGSNYDYRGIVVHSMEIQLTDYLEQREQLFNSAADCYRFLKRHYELAQKDGMKDGMPESVPEISPDEIMESETGDRDAEFYRECAKVSLDLKKKVYYQSEMMALYQAEKIACVIQEILQSCDTVVKYIEELYSYYYNENRTGLIQKEMRLVKELKKNHRFEMEQFIRVNDTKEKLYYMHRLIGQYASVEMPLDRSELEDGIAALLSSTVADDEPVEEEDTAADTETEPEEKAKIQLENVTELLTNSLQQIMDYAQVSQERQTQIRKAMTAFVYVKDRLSTSDNIRLLKKQLTTDYFELYKNCIFRWLNGEEVPLAVRLFLNYGYMDERLLEDDQIRYLCSVLQEDDEQQELACTIYRMPEWLREIYEGRKETSRNSFERDYRDELREKKRTGRITESQEKEYLQDSVRKVTFEIDNMFASNNKIVNGKLSTYTPVLYNDQFFGDIERLYVSKKKLSDAIAELEKMDFSVFYREVLYTNPKLKIDKEYVLKHVYPDVILAPVYGITSSMWQEITGKKRDTPGRFIFPVFSENPVEKSVVKAFGRFHWEYCRCVQGVSWNNIQYRSLTSEYMDYIQYYRKNHDLSEEKRDKIKQQIQRARNNSREIFLSDYEQWIYSEAKSAMKLNKVSRQILATYCPFNREIREALKTNMAFADAMMKQQKNYGEKAHEWELRIRKRENNNLPVPEEFYETYDYYANK